MMSHALWRRFGAATLTVSAFALAAAPAAAQQGPAAEAGVAETVTVTGYRAQNEEAVRTKREAEIVADFLSSDDIGQQPDYNIADSFRRLPGVQTVFDEDEGRYVSIRGLNPSYTLGALDGSTIATAERGGRQLNMESIPSTAVKRIEVQKSRTPATDGNAIGGTLNLITRSAFDRPGFYAAGNAFIGTSDSQAVPGEGYNRDSDDGINYRVDGTVSYTFGAADQFGVLFTGNYSVKRRDQERLLPQVVPTTVSPTRTPVSALGQVDLLWSTYPNSVNRYGGTLKLEWMPSDAFDGGASFTYFQQDDNELRHSLRLRNGTGANATFVRFNDFPIEKPLLVGQTWANWTPNDDHSFDARVSYSEATFSEPSNELLFRLSGAAPTFDVQLSSQVAVPFNVDPRVANPASYAFTSYTPYEDDSDEYVMEAQANWGWNTERGDYGWGLGAGVKLREITRDNDRTQTLYTGYTGTTPLTLDQFDLPTSYTPIYAGFNQIFVDFAAFERFFNANRQLFTVDVLNTNRQTIGSDWVVEERVSALYGLIRHAGERHSLIFGGRFERTETDVERFSRTATGGLLVSDFRRTTQEGEYDDFLPSVTLAYDLTDRLKLRSGIYAAVGRPNLSSLGGSETINADGSISRGNAELQAREGVSTEASLEYYFPGDQGVATVGVFRKDIDNEIETLVTFEDINGVRTQVNQPVNIATAEITGIELMLLQNRLEFLPGPLADFGFSLNATFFDFTPVLTGQADFLGNFALFYERGPFQARATYAYLAATPTGGGRLDKHTNNLDLQARFQLLERVELIGEVRNATDENKVNFFGPEFQYARDVNFYGRQFWIGAAFRY
jgi:TonB-dependent receptor